MAFKNLKKHFFKFLKRAPGTRFQHYYDAVNRHMGHNITVKIILMFLGILSFFIGFILLFIPGPGMLFITLAGVLFCLCTRRLAVLFDRTEVKIRQWYNERFKKAR